MTEWTKDTEELAALDALRATFAAAAELIHAVAADAGEIAPAGGHVPTP